MAFNLVETIKSQVTPDIIQGASRYVGAEPAATQKALDAAVPTVVGGLVRQGSSPQGAERLLGMLSTEPTRADTTQGQGTLHALFGDKLGSITEVLSKFTSLGTSSISSLLGLVAPLATAVLGKHVREEHLDANGLQRLMGEQKESVERALPPGLADIAGGVPRATPYEGRPTAYRTPARPAPKSGLGPAVPIILGLLAVLAFWATFRGPRPRGAGRTPEVSAVSRKVQRQVAVAEMTSAVSGVAGLQQVLSGHGGGALPRRFTLSGTAFEPGTAQLASISYVELTQLGDVLKHHPNARVRIEGAADSGGDVSTGERLSEERAVAVRDTLVNNGVNGNQVETRGQGAGEAVGGSGVASNSAQPQTHVVLVAK
jgi:outer membrane protein OmpA-like peptidoglycan-associated protein